MVLYRIHCKGLKKKVFKIIKQYNLPNEIESVYGNTLTLYFSILMSSYKYRTFNRLKKSDLYQTMLKIVENASVQKEIDKNDVIYPFASISMLKPISNLISNENVYNLFLKVFDYKNFSKDKKAILKSLLNDIAILFWYSKNHKKVKNYKLIDQKSMTVFVNILEINKNVQTKIQILFPLKSNEFIILTNILLDL